ncbi:membrane protein insertase YidC [Neoroseomonas oryzicola]|uniref:Membrane protein insertase YidC n=1 Tax=Neoroseomonas oryzicola TaxID=535904 RepID=A0A9X9WMC7_9PROT|nr:membrane protein insertase YidC [Neoroseomonas oryzicola]MBR0661487.1 membrane protein insertase YidC [Neoroseomonas oryzicola]NKE19101.1 membrane protein insertase YidC [Neoroseomonas oryzicola]
MDQKRLFAAIALSIGILLIFDVWNRTNTPPTPPRPQQQQAQTTTPAVPAPSAGTPAPATGAPGDQAAAPATPRPPAARVAIENPRVAGSINLRGARIDDLVLTTYRETLAPNSPQVRLLDRRDSLNPYFAQWGWTAADGRTRVPDNETDWTATGGPLAPGRPVTLTWDNGQGQVFEIVLSLDAEYMVTAEQRVRNDGSEPVSLLPWARVRREHTPQTAGFYILHEGFTGVLGGRLREVTYSDAKSEGARRGGIAMEQETTGGWAGFTDKYWLAAIMPAAPDQTLRTAYRHANDGGGAAGDRWQVDMALPAPVSLAPGASTQMATRLFAGAKEVHLLDSYMNRLNITDFDKAIDFGWFYFLVKPFFLALDWIFRLTGNFGVAILIFTVLIKAAFFPLANKAYHSMARMKALAPKMTEIKERYKDDPQKAQSEMMALYRTEKVNPASGCLPILIQIPVFFALYKALFVTIEMRHQPFFGWIHDLSAPDPTNLFNLFGLLPFQPEQWSHFLHMPAWAVIMGITMFVQQKLNPPPPDPIQAKIFQWMPIIFTFMLASMPSGLIIYWAWNNTLSIGQQYYIMRHDRAAAKAAKATGKAK